MEVNSALVERYSSCAQLKVRGTVCWAKHVGAEVAVEVTESWQQFISTLLEKWLPPTTTCLLSSNNNTFKAYRQYLLHTVGSAICRRSGGRRMHTKARSARILLGVASALQASVDRSAVADRKRVGINNMGADSNLQGV